MPARLSYKMIEVAKAFASCQGGTLLSDVGAFLNSGREEEEPTGSPAPLIDAKSFLARR